MRDGLLIADPKTIEERRKVAADFAAQFSVSVPILVDGLDDKTRTEYASWPDRIYVVGPDGSLAYVGGPGPGGFRPSEAPPVLDRLLSGQPEAPAAPAFTGARPPRMPAQERIRTQLSSAGLSESDVGRVLDHARDKREAFRMVMLARARLTDGEIADEAATALLREYEEAAEAYRRKSAAADRALDKAIGFKAKPRLHLLLAGLGLVGEALAPPMNGVGPPMRPFPAP